MVDLLVSAIANMIAEALNAAVNMIMPLLDFDFDSFNMAFPFAANAYSIFQSVAVAIALLLAAFQIFPMLSGQSQTKTTPVRAGLFAILSVFGIYYGNYILTAIMEIAQAPYDAMMNADSSSAFTFAFDPVLAVITDAAYQVSIIIYIVLLLLIGIAFIKLLLEAVERYVILFVLVYLSPLASSTLASEPTSGIFKRFLSMFISQCVLLILNVWSLKMSISLFDGLGASTNPVLSLMLGYAFLRIASKLDSYLNQLGLSAAVTGAGLGSELMATGMMMLSKLGGLTGGKNVSSGSASGGSGSSSGILGFSQKLSSGIGKISPVAGAADAGKNAVQALGKTAGQGLTAAKEAMAGTSGSLTEKLGAGVEAAGNTLKQNVGKNLHDASMKTQGSSLWARGAAQAANAKIDGTGVDSLVKNAVSGEGLTADERHDLASNAFVGDKVMNSFEGGNETSESADVAATMQSIGLEDADPKATDAINAGYGNIDAEDVDFVQNENGIQANFSKDGWNESWDVKTAAQYNALSPDAQQAYTAFKSANGGQYYYSHSRSRAPSAMQKEQMAVSSAVAAFSASPQTTSLSQSEWASVSKNPDAYNKTWNGLRESGQTLGGSDTEKTSIKGMLSATKTSGSKLVEGKNAAIAHMDDADASWDGRSAKVSWNQENGSHQFEILSQDEAAQIGSPAQLHEMGYSAISVGDETYFAKYSAPPTDQEQLTAATTQFVTDPQTYPMSEKNWSDLTRSTSEYNGVWAGMATSNVSLAQNTADQKQIGGMMSASRAPNAKTTAGRNEAIAYLNSGKAEVAQMNGNGAYVSWTNADGYRCSYSMLTERGAQTIGVTSADLHTAGYEAVDIGGETYYAHYQGAPAKQEQLSKAITDFASSPQKNLLSSSDYSEMWKSPDHVNQLFTEMEANGTSLIYTPGAKTPENAQIADFISNSRVSGISPVEKSKAVTSVLSGEAKYAKLDGRGITVEYDDNGEGHRVTILSPNAVENPAKIDPKISGYVGNMAAGAAQEMAPKVIHATAPTPVVRSTPPMPRPIESKPIIENPTQEKQLPNKQNNSAPKIGLEELNNRAYVHNVIGNDRYYASTERHLSTKEPDKGTNDLT